MQPDDFVIEIEAGVGDPPFVTFSRGVVANPLSVGRRAMWRVEANHVLDVHAYLYFDGSQLFVRSADEGRPARVNGRAVGRSWTPSPFPCEIELGDARLYAHEPHIEETQALSDRETVAQSRPPVAKPSARRPFEPGALAVSTDDESTRFQPLDVGRVTPKPASARFNVQQPTPAAVPESAQAPTPQPRVDAPKPAPVSPPGAERRSWKQTWQGYPLPTKIVAIFVPLSLVCLGILAADLRRKPTKNPIAVEAGAPIGSAFASASASASSPSLPTPSGAPTALPHPTSSSTPVIVAPVPIASADASHKSLERQAVDLVASGQYERAAALYDQLARQYPNKPAFADAARILRSKLDGGL